MPKQVDHDQRRAGIVDALFRVAARDGLAAASIRAVAAEAGVPAPQVQYYFGTKAALLNAALFRLGERVVGRGLELMREAGDDPTPETLLRAALAGSRPVDEESRHNLVLFFVFFVAALTEPAMAETGMVAAQRGIGASFAGFIRESQRGGETPPEIDPDHEARLILCANTGLLLLALAGVHSVDEATAALEYHLQRVFPPRIRRP